MPKPRPVTLATLRRKLPKGTFLLCTECGERNSADAGDYFMLPDEHVFRCCDKPMRLVTARTVFTDVVTS